MRISEYFNKELIVTNLDVKSKEEIFKVLFKKLYDNGFVKESFLDAIIKREKTFPTGLQLNTYNVAIPHTDPEHVIKPAIAIATLSKPVIFKNMANPLEEVNVSIVFMMALNEAHSQVEMLQQMVQLIQNDTLLEKIIEANGGDKIIDIIKNASFTLN
ncbi:MAG: Phosphoenolpyruvate-dependent sugar phosphotransferase system EIIA 2 [Caldanaerobacter subterraneus]|jgi:PTS system galactitol-specific IIA component|uniref:Phosphoenolpyruvate-dependent sugar phosphotransferase system EIIA 2 n=4 Tax=Thermoanaerobacter TaxID=1754 RepID=E8URD6_THEBF|nr:MULTISPECIES: PTS sugar transporter subunit IIA [Thermoanaerobacter]EGD53073.1 putative PTS IIA-like nitrogen-regulatory protein PtsN [Thermoanaerobacter ethanolicus JW 200]KUJ91411.1 MAG: putative PTS IIA-like nitrogen-regulatory protein PtsN [Thermoanaerobacter thermocopriae]KUK34567.1 MAG: Phosphoenolpyruvate-dependent sugar phosphotransferase system EIIA 2 [Caldanaerobacter subterraneus]MDI3311784.1 PTS sugar transporter subunit IIA [Thermoanaerobacterium sp.]ABY91443.1 putative PTS IIA